MCPLCPSMTTTSICGNCAQDLEKAGIPLPDPTSTLSPQDALALRQTLRQNIRKASLQRFAKALREALYSMPNGYNGAAEDRNRFCTTIEQTIKDLEAVAPSPEEVDLDGYIDDGIQYLGKALRQPNGKYSCLANVNGNLCQVEVNITHSQG